MAAKGSATTHGGGGRGPGGGRAQKYEQRRFGQPDPTKQRSGRNVAPWYLKSYGSRPEHKRQRPLKEVA